MLNVFAPVVTDHHLIGDHERLDEALAADGAALAAGAIGTLVALRGRCAGLARCTAFNEVCTGKRQRRVEEDALCVARELVCGGNLPL